MGEEKPKKLREKSRERKGEEKAIAGGEEHGQSPIDIRRSHTVHDTEKCRPTTIHFTYTLGDCTTVKVGKSCFLVTTRENCSSTLTASHLDGTYQLEQFHAHWGPDGNSGSEHRLNGKQFAGEVHFVFRNTKYKGFPDASRERDGLAVVAVFLKEGHRNETYQTLFHAVGQAIELRQAVHFPSHFHVSNLLPPKEHRDYYTYAGSLTTPPYYECVTWTVFAHPVQVASHQLDVFRKICKSNFRQCQELGKRRVHTSKPKPPKSQSLKENDENPNHE